MALQFREKECSNCHETFRTSNDSSICYNCALTQITNGQPPEEGDYNSAGIISGTMSAQERAWLQEDLERVENGGSRSSIYFVEEEDLEERDDWKEEDDGIWDPEPEKHFRITASCPNNHGWYDYDLGVPQSQVEATKDSFVNDHKEKCTCGGEPNIVIEEI